MSFQPDKITREHVLKAIEEIDKGELDIPNSTIYDIAYNGKTYPPKATMRLAHKFAVGKHLWHRSGGETTNKYLKEMGFKIVEKDSTNATSQKINYWLFQSKYGDYNTTEALRAGHINSLKVVNHKTRIKPGDKVILWLTGENAGCYALADVISGVDTVPEEPYESLYYTSEEQKEEREEEDRIKIQITHNLVDNPILWTSIRDLPEFKDFKGGNQGTNFRDSEEEYETLLRMHEPNYWVFQGNPEIYDINEALRAEHLKSWKVAAHKKRIRTGDKVILWQTGNQAGCY